MAAVAMLVGSRAVHFASTGLPGPVDSLVGRVLSFEFMLSLGAFLFGTMLALAFIVCLVLLIIRRRWCIEEQQGQFRLRPWLAGLLWTALAALSFLLDLNPDLGLLFAGALPLVALAFLVQPLQTPAGRKAVLAAWVAVLTIWVTWLPEVAPRGFGAAWVVVAATTCFFGSRYLVAPDVIGLLLGLAAALQLYSLLPGAIPNDALVHGGTVLGDVRVYSFCELP